MAKRVKVPAVALVGRTNVGKSTLFNRVVGAHKAIISRQANTTRDRNVGRAYWRGVPFDLIDTGGLDVENLDDVEEGIVRQAMVALESADVILFMVDAKNGILPDDRKIAKLLRKFQDKVMVVANKLDKPTDRSGEAAKFLKLGFGEPSPVSAISGGGSGEMLDELIKRIPARRVTEFCDPTENVIRVAIVGKPNVGKSSLLNAMLGQERVIVSDIPHTTREPIDTEITYKGQRYIVMDTAGIRKRTKIPDLNTKKGIEQTLDSLRDADVVLFLVEAQDRVTAQDARVASEILERGPSVVLTVNKWDLIKDKETGTVKEFETYFRAKFPYLKWVPMIFVSAKEKQRARKILEVAKEIYDERIKRIDAKALDNFFTRSLKYHKPPKDPNGKRIYVYGMSQLETNPPVFELRRKGKARVQEEYVRYLENRIRDKFGFVGTPIRINVRTLRG